MSVATRLKVLVSCMKRAASTRLAIGFASFDRTDRAILARRARAVDGPLGRPCAWPDLPRGARSAIMAAAAGGPTDARHPGDPKLGDYAVCAGWRPRQHGGDRPHHTQQ